MAFNLDEILSSIYGSFQPDIDGLFHVYDEHIKAQNRALEATKESIERCGAGHRGRIPLAGKRAIRKTSRRKSSLLQTNSSTQYPTRSCKTIEEDEGTKVSARRSSEKSPGPSTETLAPNPGIEADDATVVPDVENSSGKSTASGEPGSKSSLGSSEKENEPEQTPLVRNAERKSLRCQQRCQPNKFLSSDAEKTPAKMAPKTPLQARERLRQIVGCPVSGSAGKNRQLFSPYGKYSTREKAMAFEQKLACSPSVADVRVCQPKAIIVLESKLRTSCKNHMESLQHVGKEHQQDDREMEEQPSTSTTTSTEMQVASFTNGVPLRDDTLVISARKEEDTSTKDRSPQRKKVVTKKVKVKHRVPSLTRTTPLVLVRKKSVTSASPGLDTPKVGGFKNPANSFRRVSRQLLRSQKSPVERSRKPSDSSQEREVARKQEYMKLKSAETKKKRESRAARVRATKEQQEQKRLQEKKLQEMKKQQLESKRLEKRKEFHKRTQSEREKEVGVRGHMIKRKGASPEVTQAKRVHQDVPHINGVNVHENSFEASRLLFFEPSTCLSNKAKLNNSMQQQAMLNSLSQSIRNELPESATHENAEGPTGSSVQPALNQTFQKGQVLDSTYIVEACEDAAVEACDSLPKTPVADSTFLKLVTRSSGYDITPHHSELPPEPIDSPDNYNIENLQSGDETDDDERPRKEVPPWAKGSMLQKHVARQANKSWEPDSQLFGELVDIDIRKVFTVQKKYFNKRTSSAIWTSPVAKSP